MSEVDDYLKGVDDPANRAALDRVCAIARELIPEAVDGTSYGMPALKYRGRPLIGFLAARQHLSIFPFSSEVVDGVRDDLVGFSLSSGTIRFSAAKPIPDATLRRVITLRRDQIERRSGATSRESP